MAEEINYNNPQLQEEEEESINLYAIFFKYLIYWPWFIASVLVCVIGAYVYLRYQTPVYNVRSAVLIKEQDKRRAANNNAMAAISDMGMFSMTNNFDNEILILQSHTMVKKAVTDLELYINHSKERKFGYNQPLYKNEPVKVYMSPEEADKLQGGVKVSMNYDTNRQLKVKIAYTKNQEKKEIETHIKQLPTAFPTEIGRAHV